MLVTPKLQYPQHLKKLLADNGISAELKELETGIFIAPLFDKDCVVGEVKDEYNEWIDGEFFDCIGVCDNIEQIKKKYQKWINDPDLKFFISVTKVVKSEARWFRWRKNGQYIGIKKPKHEYLYNEDDYIKEVYHFHIYQLLN